jgi:hypothetical protein
VCDGGGLMTVSGNAQALLDVIRKTPGLDDDELSRRLGVTPRQQVNQICRRLESECLIERRLGPRGKLVNLPVQAQTVSTSAGDTSSREPQWRRLEQSASEERGTNNIPKPVTRPPAISIRAPHHNAEPLSPPREAVQWDAQDTLFLIPCSGTKISGGDTGVPLNSILVDALPELLRDRLRAARSEISRAAQVDERQLLPAWQRYTGSLYDSARVPLHQLVAGNPPAHVLVLSGRYGVVHARDPIGTYEKVFRMTDWPRGLLEEIILAYVRRAGVRRVAAFASLTTEYGKLLRGISWRASVINDAWLFSPESTTGAMVKSPRAQGEALTALVAGQLHQGWRSSDGLALHAIRLFG